MARITISDALPHVDSKYELGILAAQRVRDLNGGEPSIIYSPATEKLTVTALREIASGDLDVDILRRELIQSYKKTPVVEETEALESATVAPELKELDNELSGNADQILTSSSEIVAEIDAELSAETEDTETVESIEDNAGAVDTVSE